MVNFLDSQLHQMVDVPGGYERQKIVTHTIKAGIPYMTFADDTIIYVANKNINYVSFAMKGYLLLQEWLSSWKPLPSQLTLFDTEISLQDKVKCLGITIDKKLTGKIYRLTIPTKSSSWLRREGGVGFRSWGLKTPPVTKELLQGGKLSFTSQKAETLSASAPSRGERPAGEAEVSKTTPTSKVERATGRSQCGSPAPLRVGDNPAFYMTNDAASVKSQSTLEVCAYISLWK
uniref:Reverse transcriptase domain-containing protein n=1 Tax=Timema monikensis TaxID=170555 RepID=A0A7R9HTM4_9NEOP|nr:unnamed protein product [Timema monikensis]